MNPIIKRGLAIGAIAPLAFIAAVGPANAASSNYVEGDANRVGDSRLVTVTDCVHPLNDDLRMEVYLLTGGGVYTDRDDVEEVTVLVSDEDMQHGYGPDDVAIDTPYTNARSVKVEYFSDNYYADGPSDLTGAKPKKKRTDRVRQGRAQFDTNVDDVRWMKVTAKWSEVPLAEDDSEQLTCYFEINE